MRVKCITNTVDELNDAAVRTRLAQSIRLDGAVTDLVVGKTYDVIALATWGDGGIRVYLDTIEGSDHPYPYPLEMFAVIDPTIPTNWCVAFEQRPFGMAISRIGFREWAEDGSFYEKLVDGDNAAIAIYRDQRRSTRSTSSRN